MNKGISIEEALHDYIQAIEDYNTQTRKLEKFLQNDEDVFEAFLREYLELASEAIVTFDEEYITIIGIDESIIQSKKRIDKIFGEKNHMVGWTFNGEYYLKIIIPSIIKEKKVNQNENRKTE